MTAEIGSMRIAEEIDAVEAMGLRPIPFVVGTRLVGGLLCVIPGYALTLLTSFFVSNVMIRARFITRPAEHMIITLSSSCRPVDLVFSTLKAAVILCCRDSNSLLLRVFRIGRPSRCWHSVWACGASESRGGHGAGLRADRITVGTSDQRSCSKGRRPMTLLHAQCGIRDPYADQNRRHRGPVDRDCNSFVPRGQPVRAQIA